MADISAPSPQRPQLGPPPRLRAPRRPSRGIGPSSLTNEQVGNRSLSVPRVVAEAGQQQHGNYVSASAASERMLGSLQQSAADATPRHGSCSGAAPGRSRTKCFLAMRGSPCKSPAFICVRPSPRYGTVLERVPQAAARHLIRRSLAKCST
jgi:hypothetical protein